ncbi:MAG: hypothetical protein DRP74_07915 [Candidatus Omnitrophota bacterium]|nr:MAG: hypothetical protein DRP74_07915 [Candidatus Omnitrophota bacterium]
MHPFNDTIEYNVSLNLPSGWSYSGTQTVTATAPGNYTLKFNLTSSNTPNNYSIIANVNYTYPANNKGLSDNKTVEMNNNIPILEIVRETPKVVGKDKVFDSILTIHNKGCAATSGATVVKEKLSTGWVPANPS